MTHQVAPAVRRTCPLALPSGAAPTRPAWRSCSAARSESTSAASRAQPPRLPPLRAPPPPPPPPPPPRLPPTRPSTRSTASLPSDPSASAPVDPSRVAGPFREPSRSLPAGLRLVDLRALLGRRAALSAAQSRDGPVRRPAVREPEEAGVGVPVDVTAAAAWLDSAPVAPLPCGRAGGVSAAELREAHRRSRLGEARCGRDAAEM